MNSTLVQASLSIFWGLLGFTAMTVAARQKLALRVDGRRAR